jgi:hypothetical protein
MAVATPAHEPEYLANCGLLDWKRILTRSRGATTVLACSEPLAGALEALREGRGKTYGASRETASDAGAPDIIERPFVLP